jgi:hypothetical protein
VLHLLKVFLSGITGWDCSIDSLHDGVLNGHDALTVGRIPLSTIEIVLHPYGCEVPLTSGKSLRGLALVDHRLRGLYGMVRHKCEINLL